MKKLVAIGILSLALYVLIGGISLKAMDAAGMQQLYQNLDQAGEKAFRELISDVRFNKQFNGEVFRTLLIQFIKQDMTELSRYKIDYLMDFIDNTREYKALVTFTAGDGNMFVDLIRKYDENIPQTWIPWFIDHGMPIDALDKYGKSALFYAVRKNNKSLVQELINNKANPYTLITLHEQEADSFNGDRQITVLAWAEEQASKNVTRLLKEAAENHTPPAVPSTKASSPTKKTQEPSKPALTPASGTHPKAAQGKFCKEGVLAAVAAAVGLCGLYKWVMSGKSPEQKNVVINKTGANLTVMGTGILNVQHVGQEKLYEFTPDYGKLQMASDSRSPVLFVDLKPFEQKFTTHYLNITVYKRWFGWLWSNPLAYSMRWVVKDEDTQ